jgi:MFS family permease
MGELATRFGRRRVFLFGLGTILVGATIGAIASTLGTLIVARILIGIGTSAGYLLAMLLIQSESARTGSAPGPMLRALSIAAQVTVAVGLPIGGLLVGVGGWQMTFLINVPLWLITTVATLLWVRRDQRPPSPSFRVMVRQL